MRGLYAIVDVDFLNTAGVPLLPFAEAVLAGKPAALQLRAKNDAPRAVLRTLQALAPLCARAGVPLFANDRPDLAVLAHAAGVHVGQMDAPVVDVRAFAPSRRVGVSTHDPAQLGAALAAKPDYVAYGPVYATASKANPDPVVGLEGLAAAAARARAAGVPLVAIGGIDVARAHEVARFADLAAVISALLPPAGLSAVTARVAELSAVF
ncbi:MAG TPA: thiamine phosphate synthase [Polyangiaceae bacterium]|jgi:thiamine-phosphate pyrophosphorylase|nr:thiamine phosphate synthase [Polyangiaceae bacterium]